MDLYIIQYLVVHIIMLLSIFFTVYVFYNFFKEKKGLSLTSLNDSERLNLFRIRFNFVMTILSALIMIVLLSLYIYEDCTYTGHRGGGLSNWSQQEIEAFNNMFIKYGGKQYKESISSLLDLLIKNSDIFSDEPKKVPSVVLKDLFSETTIIYDPQYADDYDPEIEYVPSLKGLKQKLSSVTSYDVSFEYNTIGFINKVIIESKGSYRR